uniref:Translational initiation factor 1 n=1 Tax=Thelypteris tonkinensis TaxID=1132552 RepID=A0A411NJ40_9MONI|nr:translational initiation factor 1 [Mesopteris tonkinensis]QBF44712.1 translational initiation factor 1 [Mesopteris tonkinensis]
MKKQNLIDMEGTVTESLPNAMFRACLIMDAQSQLTYRERSDGVTQEYYQEIGQELNQVLMILPKGVPFTDFEVGRRIAVT